MTDKKFYIVVDYCTETGYTIFKDICFSKEAAQAFIDAQPHRYDYKIEIYKESKDGTAIEVFE